MAAYRVPSSSVAATPGARLLTVEQAAERIEVSKSQIYVLLKEGTLGSVKIGRLRRIPTTEVDRYISSLCENRGPDPL